MKVGSPRWIGTISRLFGVSPELISVDSPWVRVADRHYRVDGNVIVVDESSTTRSDWGSKEDVRRSFGEEWLLYSSFLPEHVEEFEAYFDLISLNELNDKLVLDLGCGSGRWSSMIADYCETVVAIDFSDAIYAAEANLAGKENVLLIRADVTDLPFADDCSDFLFSLGVLHHLDQPCLPVARDLMRLAPEGLFYLYYNLDNRPWYFRSLLAAVSRARHSLRHVRSDVARERISKGIAIGVYRPLVGLGDAFDVLRIPVTVPLHSTYKGKSIRRIEQDAYDRFFTSIEQRVTREEIVSEFASMGSLQISPGEPFWHFVVQK